MPDDFLSTGQAAKMCAVTRDTVLKWIKLGKLQAVRTPGGHYRIRIDSLRPYLSARGKEEGMAPVLPITYCWEYHAREGELQEECKECFTYKSRTQKCYLLAQRDGLSECSGVLCRGNCFECKYFRLSERSEVNVLIMTDSEAFKGLLESDGSGGVNLRFSRCEYESSEVLREFVPDFVVMEFSKMRCSAEEIREQLARKEGLVGTQIVMTIAGDGEGGTSRKKVSAALPLPVDVSKATECILEAGKEGGKREAGRPEEGEGVE